MFTVFLLLLLLLFLPLFVLSFSLSSRVINFSLRFLFGLYLSLSCVLLFILCFHPVLSCPFFFPSLPSFPYLVVGISLARRERSGKAKERPTEDKVREGKRRIKEDKWWKCLLVFIPLAYLLPPGASCILLSTSKK